MNKNTVPEWIMNLAGKFASMFFLDGWIIKAHAHDDPSRPEGNEAADGLASFNTRYKTADLYFDTRLDKDEYGCEVVMHEVLHPVFGEMRDTVNHIIEFCMEDDRAKFQSLYDGAEEKLITTLARGMSKSFDLKQWADKNESPDLE
jgi:hypothetical protein